MFKRTIDNKPKYENQDGIEIIDLGEPIFKNDNIYAGLPSTFVKVGMDMDMRPDLVSLAVYNDEEYTDLVMKYNDIQNPFSIQEGDVLIVPSVMKITDNITTAAQGKINDQDDLIRAHHQFVTDSKKPKSNGSEENTTQIKKTENTKEVPYKEANLADKGTECVKQVDTRLYFGANSGLKCATSGIETSDYIRKVIEKTTREVK